MSHARSDLPEGSKLKEEKKDVCLLALAKAYITLDISST